MLVPLEIPPMLVPLGVGISDLNWGIGQQRRCARGDVVAHAYVLFGRSWTDIEYANDCQVAFRLPCDGIVRGEPNDGGWRLVNGFRRWERRAVGSLEIDDDPRAMPVQLAPMFIASRRRFSLTDVKGPLGASWADCTRAWWGMEHALDLPAVHLLSLGICEQRVIVRGDALDFAELAGRFEGPFHATFVPDDVIVPTARTLTSQLRRTDEDRLAIREDFGRAIAKIDFGDPEAPATVASMTALLAQLMLPSPIRESPLVAAPMGFFRIGAPRYVLLSFVAEATPTYVHKELGYAIAVHAFRYANAGPQFRRWLGANFTRPRSDAAATRAAFVDLVREIRANGDVRILVLNETCSSPDDAPPTYAGLDAPFTRMVGARERNRLLRELARELDLVVVDIDAMAAELGTESAGNGVHPNRVLADAVRRELARVIEWPDPARTEGYA